MVELPSGTSVGVKDLAAYQGVSETYLSKIYTKLKKAGLVSSIPGVHGGYGLARAPESISFWDVVEAVEGKTPFFQCAEIRQKEILLDQDNLPDAYSTCPCLIKVVMLEAEEQMKQYLASKTLYWLAQQLKDKIPEDHAKATTEWFKAQRKQRGALKNLR